jgi:hypothetical protein
MDFYQLFNSWYNKESDKAEDILTLMFFEKEGNANIKAVCDDNIAFFPLLNGTLARYRKFYYNTA